VGNATLAVAIDHALVALATSESADITLVAVRGLNLFYLAQTIDSRFVLTPVFNERGIQAGVQRLDASTVFARLQPQAELRMRYPDQPG
jgi:hypothetical protein